MTGSHSSSQPDDVIGRKKVSWNLSPGSYRELQLGRGVRSCPGVLNPQAANTVCSGRPLHQRHRKSLWLTEWSKMEKDKPPQLVTPASVKAIISRIEAAQLTRAQEVTPEMKMSPFCWGLMGRPGTDARFGQDSSSGPLWGLRILSKLGLWIA